MKAGFDINELKPEEAAKECEAPAYFIHGENDNFIVPEHSVKCHAAYKGQNKVLR